MKRYDLQGYVPWVENDVGDLEPLKSSLFGSSGGTGLIKSLDAQSVPGPGSVLILSGLADTFSIQIETTATVECIVSLEVTLDLSAPYVEIGQYSLVVDGSSAHLTFYPHVAKYARLNVLSISDGVVNGWIGSHG